MPLHRGFSAVAVLTGYWAWSARLRQVPDPESLLAGIARILTPVACFELGNLATTLLILRATDLQSVRAGWTLTAATSAAILMYAGHNAVAAATSLIAGQLADPRSPRLVLAPVPPPS